MEKLRVFYDREGRTLTVWFDDPQKEHVCEETGEEIVLIKNKDGGVIGFERLNVDLETKVSGSIPLEAVTI